MQTSHPIQPTFPRRRRLLLLLLLLLCYFWKLRSVMSFRLLISIRAQLKQRKYVRIVVVVFNVLIQRHATSFYDATRERETDYYYTHSLTLIGRCRPQMGQVKVFVRWWRRMKERESFCCCCWSPASSLMACLLLILERITTTTTRLNAPRKKRISTLYF